MTHEKSDITAAVLTGGHGYDVPNFHRLFRGLEGIDAYIQSMDDFAASPRPTRDAYDAVVFYTMFKGEPHTRENSEWWQGDHRAAIERLAETSQGLVLLHHAILGHVNWPLWRGWVGVPDPQFVGYHHDETIRCEVADPEHPVTAGLSDWEMTDETYVAADPGDNSRVLITTDHPRSMRALAWTREPPGRRVFCYVCGHDNEAWAEPSFRETLKRGILWTCGRL